MAPRKARQGGADRQAQAAFHKRCVVILVDEASASPQGSTALHEALTEKLFHAPGRRYHRQGEEARRDQPKSALGSRREAPRHNKQRTAPGHGQQSRDRLAGRDRKGRGPGDPERFGRRRRFTAKRGQEVRVQVAERDDLQQGYDGDHGNDPRNRDAPFSRPTTGGAGGYQNAAEYGGLIEAVDTALSPRQHQDGKRDRGKGPKLDPPRCKHGE